MSVRERASDGRTHRNRFITSWMPPVKINRTKRVKKKKRNKFHQNDYYYHNSKLNRKCWIFNLKEVRRATKPTRYLFFILIFIDTGNISLNSLCYYCCCCCCFRRLLLLLFDFLIYYCYSLSWFKIREKKFHP